MVNIIRGDVAKPASSRKIADYFETRSDIEGTLYLAYPLMGTSQGSYLIDALLVSRVHGMIIFNIVEGIDQTIDWQEFQDEIFTKAQSKLLQYKDLVEKRKLMVAISVVTYAPAWNGMSIASSDSYPVITTDVGLTEFIRSQIWQNSDYFEILKAATQATTAIKKRKPRDYVKLPESRGAKLKKLEKSIATLDRDQDAAVLETVEGVQRIRGLAGSGKTIVLASKVAYLHSNHPDWDIAVTFNTRSLKNQFKQLISAFTIEKTSQEPDWDKVKIIQAWGSPKTEGIYYEVCTKHNIEYRDLVSARKISNEFGKEFDAVCQESLSKIKKFDQYYDAILIDEAQDFPPEFLRICYKILKNPKRLIYAYDELQNLNKKIMESPETIFGKDLNGQFCVQLENRPREPKQDIILEKCYRNSRPTLTAAHALGFGIYRDSGLIQMFEHPELWKDIGYEVEEGTLKDSHPVKLARTDNTSPKFLESHSAIDDLIIFKTFNSHNEQIEWLVSQIEKNIKEDELKYDDIMVIHTDPIKTQEAVGKARTLLFEKGINSNLAGVTTSPDDFFNEKTILFTSINRAKGNEAAMIYVIDADLCFSGSELIRKRNILFTAMTRSKAWLRVIGCGENMRSLEAEYEKVKQKDFSLNFTYPSKEERENMNRVNRDMSPKELNRIEKKKKSLSEGIEALLNGEIPKDELTQEQVERLRIMFGQ
jgi:superfamily I DNA and RNA helicase